MYTLVPLWLQVPYVNSTIAIFLAHKEVEAACQVKCQFLLRQRESICLQYFYWHPFLEGAAKRLGEAGEMNESRGARNTSREIQIGGGRKNIAK